MDFRVHEIVIRFWCLYGRAVDINAADESAVRLLCQNLIQTYLSLAAVGALERIGHTTFGDAKDSVHKSEFVVFCETQQEFAIFVEILSAIYAQHFTVCLSSALTSLPCPGIHVC